MQKVRVTKLEGQASTTGRPLVKISLDCGHYVGKLVPALAAPSIGSQRYCTLCYSPPCNEQIAKKAYLRLRECVGTRAFEVVKSYGYRHTGKMPYDVRERFIQEAKAIVEDESSKKRLKDLTLRNVRFAFKKLRKECGFFAGTDFLQKNDLPSCLLDLPVGKFQSVIDLCNAKIREANRPKGPTREDLKARFDAVNEKHGAFGFQKIFNILGVQRMSELSEDLYQDGIDACNFILAKDVTEVCPHTSIHRRTLRKGARHPQYTRPRHTFCSLCGIKLC